MVVAYWQDERFGVVHFSSKETNGMALAHADEHSAQTAIGQIKTKGHGCFEAYIYLSHLLHFNSH